jgi:hypothetical protein
VCTRVCATTLVHPAPTPAPAVSPDVYWLLSLMSPAVCACVRVCVCVFQDVEVSLIPINGHEELCPADYKLVCGDTVVSEDGLPWLYVLSPKVRALVCPLSIGPSSCVPVPTAVHPFQMSTAMSHSVHGRM